jgi:hypothetical protein
MPNHTIYLTKEVTAILKANKGDNKSNYISGLIVRDNMEKRRGKK